MFIIGKIISDGETNFTQHKYTISANMGSSTVKLHGVDLIDIQVQN